MKTSAQVALLAALAGGSCASATAANINSAASISNVYYQLVDLDLTDGIAPSVAFDFSSNVSAGVAPAFNQALSYKQASSTDANPIIKSDNAALGAETSVAINGFDMSAAGKSVDNGQYNGSAQQSIRFTLSPNTSLIVGAVASASAVGSAQLPDLSTGTLTFQITDSQFSQPFNRVVYYSNGAYSYDATLTSFSENFELSFTNQDAGIVNGTIDVYVGAAGSVSPVPEPESWAMMLAGLGLVGAFARRKHKA